MCFDLDSSPPIPPVSGAAVEHEDLVLEARDGNRLAAFAALPGEPSGIGVVVMPDVRGLYRFYEELALRLAELGHTAVAIDYFGRSAGVSKRDDSFDYMPHVKQTTELGVQVDVAAGVAWLRDERSATTIFTLGFCFGGRNSWLASAGGHGLAGAIGFYGRPPGDVSGFEAPILALQAEEDHITPEQTAAFGAALAEAGVEHEVHTYPGTTHSFFDRKHEEYAEASADAWNRVLAFVARHSA
jgi:carboxymethylenebutenolidase